MCIKGKSKGKQKKTKVTLDGFAEAFEKEKEELKEAREKKKVDDLWAGNMRNASFSRVEILLEDARS